MKPICKQRAGVLLLGAAVTLAGIPPTAGAFGFGASQFKYPPPYAGYPYPPRAIPPQGAAPQNTGPYGPAVPYGVPPGARNLRGMWGSGPGMSWGGDRSAWYKEVERRRRPHWRYTKDWVYTSPYDEPAEKKPSQPARPQSK